MVQRRRRPPLDLTGGSPPPRDSLRGLPSPGAARDSIAPPVLPPVPGAHPPSGARRFWRQRRSQLAGSRPRRNLGRVGAASWACAKVAPAQEIEAAHHAGLAECDRVRFSPGESANARVRRRSAARADRSGVRCMRPFEALDYCGESGALARSEDFSATGCAREASAGDPSRAHRGGP